MGLTDEAVDDDLMVRTAQGDEKAFRSLIERWEAPVYTFLERMTGSREDALDLSQETFLRVHARARAYDARGQFRSWLFRIAGNLARSALRRRRLIAWIRFDPQQHDCAVPGDHPGHHLERKETAQEVRRALARLGDRQRQALLLRRFSGLSYGEIAAALDTTVPAVESLLQRAMETLRSDLARKGVT